MSSAAYLLLGVVWLSVVGLVAVWVTQRSPRRRKPADELEAADAALRGRINDLEDRFEHFVKRQAGRASAARRDDVPPENDGSQTVLDLTRRARAMGLH